MLAWYHIIPIYIDPAAAGRRAAAAAAAGISTGILQSMQHAKHGHTKYCHIYEVYYEVVVSMCQCTTRRCWWLHTLYLVFHNDIIWYGNSLHDIYNKTTMMCIILYLVRTSRRSISSHAGWYNTCAWKIPAYDSVSIEYWTYTYCCVDMHASCWCRWLWCQQRLEN